jgi:hypothetical protein
MQAEVALAEGRNADALALADRIIAGRSGRDLMTALDIAARAHLELGDAEAAAEAARRGIELTEAVEYGTLTWRLRMVLARATGEATDRAAAEFRTIAERIPEPDIRAWYERQPLAPR